MTPAPQWSVVGCRRCETLFILDEDAPAETVACPCCGRTIARHTLRRRYRTDSHEEAVAMRASILQQQAAESPHVDQFELAAGDFADVAVQAHERLEAFDDERNAEVADAAGLDGETFETMAKRALGSVGSNEPLLDVLVEDHWERTDPRAELQAAAEEWLASDRLTDEQLSQAGLDADAIAEAAAPDDHEPEWPTAEPSLSAMFPGTDAPLTDHSLRIGPAVSEWAAELTDALLERIATAVRERAAERFDGAVDGTEPRVYQGWLVEDIGITAMGGEWASLLARYALGSDCDGRDDLRAQLTDVVSAGGWTSGSVDELVRGPLAAATLLEDAPSVMVAFDAPAWTDAKRDTGDRAASALRMLGRVADVSLLVSSTAVADALSRFDLGDVDVTEAFGAARHTQAEADASEGKEDVARARLDALDPWKNGYGRLLLALPDDRDRQQRTLADDPDVGLGSSAVSRYLPVLVDAGLVARDTSGRPQTVRLTSLGDAARQHIDPADGSLRHPGQQSLDLEFTGPPHPDVGAVCRAAQGREGGRDPSAQSVEEWVAAVEAPQSPYDYTRWLWGPSARRDEYVAHARYAAQAQGTVTCVDGRIREFDDSRVSYLSEIDDEVLTLVQWGGPLATAARIASTLLSRKALSKLLTPERVGEDFERLRTGDGRLLEDFDASLRSVLTRGLQIGWLSEDEADYEEFRDRIGGVRAFCLETLGEVAGTDQWDARRELMNDLQGLITLATLLYRAAGYDLVINVRCPDTANIVRDEVRHRDFCDFFKHTVPKQAAFDGANGTLSLFRETVEDRIEKREYRLPRAEDEQFGAADPTVSWVLTGRTATELRGDLEAAITREPFEQVADGEEAAPHLDVDVVNGNAMASMKRVVRRFASLKGKRVDAVGGRRHSRHQQDVERLSRVAIAATATADRPHEGNPMALAEGMALLAKADAGREWLTVDDLEHAFAQMDAREFLPDLSPSASRIVQTLLEADEPLARGDILDRTGLSTSSWERARATSASQAGVGDLRAAEDLGIVQRGQAEHAFLATLEPWWTTTSDRDAPRGTTDEIPATGVSTEADLAVELADALGVDVPYEALAWPPDLEAVYEQPELRRWRAFIWLAVASGDEYETGPPDVLRDRPVGVTRIGIASDGSLPAPALDESQVSLTEAASPNAGLEKLADGGGEGVQ